MPQTCTVKGNVPAESRADQKVQHQVVANGKQHRQDDNHPIECEVSKQIHSSLLNSDFESASHYLEELGNRLSTAQVHNSVHSENWMDLEHSSQMQPFQSTNTVQLHQNEEPNRQCHQQLPTRSMPTSFGKTNGIHQFQSASTVPTFLETEDERQYQHRFRLLHEGNIEKYSDQGDFYQLSCDSTTEVTSGEQAAHAENDEALFSIGQMNRESLDLQLCPGSLQDGDYDSNGYQSARSQNSSNNSDCKAVTEKVLVHEERQTELQHYIKMLLQKSPSSPERQQEVPTNTPADPAHSVQDNGYFQPSVSPDTNTDKSVTIFSPTIAPDRPPKPAFHKSLVRAVPLSDTEMRDPVDGTGILSPQQVGEISRLLGLYRPGPEGSSNITSAGTTPPMSDLLTYLKDLKPESRAQDVSDHRVSQEAPTRDVTSSTKPAKRNLSSTYNAAARKPVPNETTTKGSPTSSKQGTGIQTTKIISSKPLQTRLKHSAPRGNTVNSKNSSALPSTKKSDKRPVANKARQGNIWK